MSRAAGEAMQLIDMNDYTPAAKRYWWTVVPLGVAAFLYSGWQVAHLEPETMLQVLCGALVAAAVGLFPVRIPGTKISIGGAEIFIFLMLLLYGVPAAVIGAALEAGVASLRTSKRATSRIGGPAMAALAMFACGSVFAGARAHLQVSGAGLSATLGTLLAFSLLYYAAGSLLTNTLFALKKGTPVTPARFLTSFAWIALTYMSWAAIAGLLYASFERFGVPVLLVAVPTIALFVTSLHFHFQRREATERHLAQLKASDSRFQSAFTHAAIGMALVTPEGRFVQANRAFCAMLGRPEQELLDTGFRRLVHAGDLEVLQREVAKLVEGTVASVELEVRGIHRAGGDVWMSLSISFVREWTEGAHNLIVQAQDVTMRRRVEAELYHNAYHDGLTQLANRAHFDEQLNRAIARSDRHPNERFAVMYLDFDRFKMVNDSLGHKAGDQLLKKLAQRLQGTLRPTDLIARLGGDEFAILLENLHRQRDAMELAERIHKELQKPFHLDEMEVSISASIGITFSANGYRTSEAIIRDADIAMYKAKSRGKAQTAIFDASLHEHVTAQLRLENEMRRALGGGQFFLEYQPIYALRDQACVGFEALVRWRHPEMGVLQPGSFIPAAEETGLIVPLGNWVLAAACQQMRAWRESFSHTSLRMSVNVSSLQLMHRDFVAHVRHCLESNAVRPDQLTLEVTESVLMEGIENGVSSLNELRELGVTLSIDDFGTGYSSLSYLATLPIDAFKVDRSFIQEMSQGGQRNEIVRAILRLGQTLDKQVYAEGIETGAQLALLQELGCRFGQGYLLSRPLDAERAAQLAKGMRREPAALPAVA
jgi:diguanylate cyclase (GGDEF)-like protein/PAS domain S-box-containing protein